MNFNCSPRDGALFMFTEVKPTIEHGGDIIMLNAMLISRRLAHVDDFLNIHFDINWLSWESNKITSGPWIAEMDLTMR